MAVVVAAVDKGLMAYKKTFPVQANLSHPFLQSYSSKRSAYGAIKFRLSGADYQENNN